MLLFFGVGASWRLEASQFAALPLPKIRRGGFLGHNNPDSYVGYQITNMPVYWTLSFSRTTKSNKNSSNEIVPWKRCDNHHDSSARKKENSTCVSREFEPTTSPTHTYRCSRRSIPRAKENPKYCLAFYELLRISGEKGPVWCLEGHSYNHDG